ncbi:MAG: hypothetical protein ACE366_17835 [Bradymonadia bacterium]
MRADRRKFLGLTGFVAGLAVAPGWVQTALAGPKADDDCCTADEERAVLMGAYKRASKAGRPLLVLVIPEDDYTEGYTRGRAWGSFFNHGRPHHLAPLAMAEIVAVKHKTLKAVVPQVGSKEAMAVVVDTHEVPATVHRLDGPMAKLPDTYNPRMATPETAKLTWEERSQKESELVESRIAVIAEQFSDLLGVHTERMAGYAEQAQAAMTPLQRSTLKQYLDDGQTVPLDLATAGAAVVLHHVHHVSKTATIDFAGAMLAPVVHARMKDFHTPAGVLWANSGGCGTRIEYPPEPEPEDGEVKFGRRMVAVGCGMGHVPAKTSRFLHFYVSKDEW